MSERVQKVLANCEQGLSNAEKAQARRNIDAQGTLTAGRNITISESNVISAADTAQVQADWTETDSGADSYIQHKPVVPSIVKTTTTLPPTNTDIGTLKFFTDGRVVGDSSNLGLLAPNGGQSDAGKVLTLHYAGSPGIATAQWDNLPAGVEVATVTHGQAGDIETPVQKLIIDEDFGQLVADNRTVGLVAPEPLSTDNGKLLAVNGDLLEYVDAPNGVFVAYYSGYSTGHGNTSFGEIRDAHADGKLVVLKYTVLGGDVLSVLDNIDSTKAMFSRTVGVLSSGNYGNVTNQVVVVWADNTYQLNDSPLTYTAGTGIDITNNQISWQYSVGRNLHLNQNNAIQTDIPGGIWDAPTSQSYNFTVLQGADFAGAYRLCCRHNTSDKYELALSYTASGLSSTITFIGTETVIGLDNTVTVNQAAYIESAYYTPSNRFGYNSSTIFDPAQHKAIYYSGVAQIGATSDTKIAIWQDHGVVKISFTSVEVGKVGATN